MNIIKTRDEMEKQVTNKNKGEFSFKGKNKELYNVKFLAINKKDYKWFFGITNKNNGFIVIKNVKTKEELKDKIYDEMCHFGFKQSNGIDVEVLNIELLKPYKENNNNKDIELKVNRLINDWNLDIENKIYALYYEKEIGGILKGLKNIFKQKKINQQITTLISKYLGTQKMLNYNLKLLMKNENDTTRIFQTIKDLNNLKFPIDKEIKDKINKIYGFKKL